MKLLYKYQVVLSFCLIFFLCCVIWFYISSNLSSNEYSSKVGDTFSFGINLVDNKIENLYYYEKDKNHIMSVSEKEATFLLNSGYYKIIEVSDDFDAVFYKPIFEGEELFSETIPIYKSYMKDLEETDGTLVPMRYIPYMVYKDNKLFNVNATETYLEELDSVDINNFLVYRYSQMQVLRGKIKIEKIGLLQNK